MSRLLSCILVSMMLCVGPGLAVEAPLSTPQQVVVDQVLVNPALADPASATAGEPATTVTSVTVDLEGPAPTERARFQPHERETVWLGDAHTPGYVTRDRRASTERARLAVGSAPTPSLHTRLCVFLC